MTLFTHGFLTAMFIFTGCSASKKAYQKAQEYEEAGLYVEAAQQDLKALREKSDYKEALVHLRSVAPKAYDELLNRANKLETSENWDQAVQEYELLNNLLQQFHNHGVVFEAVNVRERLKKAQHQAAEFHYTKGDSLFENYRWEEAAQEYLQSHDFIENYNNSFNKAILSFLKAGDYWLAKENYVEAIDAFERILEIAPGHRKATRKLAESHYQLGKQNFKEERYREALDEFERTEELVADYKDVAKLAQRSLDKAVQRVAIFPFQNLSRSYLIDGYLLASEITNQCIYENLKFAVFLSDAQIADLMNSYKRAFRGAVSETRIVHLARKEGITSFVWGKVREITVQDSPKTFTEHEYERTETVQDTSGQEIEETVPIYYREYEQLRRVRMRVEYVIIDSGTGNYLDKQRFMEETVDKARWIAYQGSIYDLPENKRYLLDAPQNPRPPEMLIDELAISVSKKISRSLTRFYK
ncbi:MAG: tetratricopeptide repeat protein [bacterium]